MYETKCLTCMKEERESEDGRRYSWSTKTKNQAELIMNIHISRFELHKAEVEEIE